MTLALLCSGQGLQGPQTFALTGDAPAAAPLFRHAADLLGGRDPRALVHDADAAVANRTGQILCVLQALAAAACLGDAVPRRRIVAGYSVGEVAAWGVAGAIDARATLDLVARRAEAMDAATHEGDGLLFVRGVARAALDGLCRTHGAAVAIVEPGDAVVLGGSGASLAAVADAARAAGATRVVRLAVHVAAHTPRLAAAATAFRTQLDDATVRMPAADVRLLRGIDGTAVLDVRTGLDALAAQIAQPVQWASGLDACVEAGAVAFLELGPGHALAEMAARAHPGLPARSVEDFRTPGGVRAWLARTVG